MWDLKTLTPKRFSCDSRKDPNPDLWGREGSITISTLNWQLVVSSATVQHVGNARKVLFPQHMLTTKNITVRQKRPAAVSQADTERKSHKHLQHSFLFFTSRCYFQTCSVIHCTVNLFVVFQLVQIFLTP